MPFNLNKNTEQKPVRSGLKKILLIGLALILVLIAGFVAFNIVRDDDDQPDQTTAIPEAGSSDFVTRIIDQEDQDLNEESLIGLYRMRGAQYVDEGNYALALRDFLAADEKMAEKTYYFSAQIAQTAKQAGDTATAIRYFERAKQELAEQEPDNTEEMQLIDTELNVLKGEQQ